MRRPAQRHSGTGFAVLVVLLFACVTLAGEYVVREMGTPDVGTVLATLNRAWGSAAPALETLVASLNRAWSSAAPARGEQTAPDVEPQPLVQAPLPSAALVTPLQPSLPSEQRLLDLDPREDNQFQLDRRSKEGPAVTANKGVTTSPRAVATVGSDRRSKEGPAVTANKGVTTTPRAVATVGSERRSARPVDVLAATRETPPATPIARSTPPASRPDQGVLQTSAQEQRGEIEDVLRRYELAYRRLDAGGAKAVWPALDEQTLSRTFERLSWQEVRFDRCIIHLSSPDAEAVCAGVAAYARKAGNREPRSERRRWTFQLRKADGAWTIVRADARQDDRP
jgi:hypothetical protein